MPKTISVRERIAANPRLTAAAFALFFLLTQAGNAAAAAGLMGASGNLGP